MHFIQPMHLQGYYVSQHHQQVACGETHRVPWGIPLGLLEGGDSFWQLHAAACFSSPLYPQLPISPTPQVPSPGGREAADAVVPLVPAGAAPTAWSPLLYTAPQRHQADRCASQGC